MKKNILITILVIACVVLCFLNVGILQEKTKIITKNTQLQELNDSITKELFNYQMSPVKLQQKADIALDNEDEETIKEVIALLEKYHPETSQYKTVKHYLRRLEFIREEEEKRFRFDVCGIYVGMSKDRYNSHIRDLKSSGKLSLYTDGIYCMSWFRTEEDVVVKAFGARSTREETFSMPSSYMVILCKLPTFVDGKLSSIELLLSPSFEDDAIVGTQKNIDFISNYLNSIFEREPVEQCHWLEWKKNEQSVELYKRTSYDDVGLPYYRLVLSTSH